MTRIFLSLALLCLLACGEDKPAQDTKARPAATATDQSKSPTTPAITRNAATDEALRKAQETFGFSIPSSFKSTIQVNANDQLSSRYTSDASIEEVQTLLSEIFKKMEGKQFEPVKGRGEEAPWTANKVGNTERRLAIVPFQGQSFQLVVQLEATDGRPGTAISIIKNAKK